MSFDRKQELLHLIMVYREDREIMTTPLAPRPVSQNKQGPSLSKFLEWSKQFLFYLLSLFSPSLPPQNRAYDVKYKTLRKTSKLYVCQRRIFNFFGVQVGGITSRQKLVNEELNCFLHWSNSL